MINNQDSLCHRVFKARFFPDCSILEARDSNVGSYAWKSILSARDVIRRGMVWRVGTGERVRIKEDRWLPEKGHKLIISLLTQVPAETKVSYLINQDRVRWNEEMV